MAVKLQPRQFRKAVSQACYTGSVRGRNLTDWTVLESRECMDRVGSSRVCKKSSGKVEEAEN